MTSGPSPRAEGCSRAPSLADGKYRHKRSSPARRPRVQIEALLSRERRVWPRPRWRAVRRRPTRLPQAHRPPARPPARPRPPPARPAPAPHRHIGPSALGRVTSVPEHLMMDVLSPVRLRAGAREVRRAARAHAGPTRVARVAYCEGTFHARGPGHPSSSRTRRWRPGGRCCTMPTSPRPSSTADGSSTLDGPSTRTKHLGLDDRISPWASDQPVRTGQREPSTSPSAIPLYSARYRLYAHSHGRVSFVDRKRFRTLGCLASTHASRPPGDGDVVEARFDDRDDWKAKWPLLIFQKDSTSTPSLGN